MTKKTLDDRVTVNKRRKAIKSCTFCRKRKKKCDQKKPMCSNCLSKGLPECIYTDEFSYQLSTKRLLDSTPNVQLLKKIQELEQRLKQCENASSETGNKQKNPLEEFYVLSQKRGRYIFFGPTSIRSILSSSGPQFDQQYSVIWERVKSERQKWKKYNKNPLPSELGILKDPLNLKTSLMEAVCAELPTYETVEREILKFFDSPLYQCFNILDKEKVLNDLHKCFTTDKTVTDENEHLIVSLELQEKDKCYKIGVILGVMSCVYYNTKTPDAIQKFIKFLMGLNTSKVCFVERAQFLMLRYVYHVYNGITGGDGSYITNLVNIMCDTALLLGMHRKISHIYKGQERIIGSLSSMKTLWLWILFADLDISFNMGRPLRVTNEYFSDDELENDEEASCMNCLLKDYISLARKCMKGIFNRDKYLNLKQMIEDIIFFIEKKFKPIENYTNIELPSHVEPRQLLILSSLFCMLTTFYTLRRLSFKENSCEVENGCIKFSLISLSISIATTIKCFELDQDHFPELLEKGAKSITPFLNMSILLRGNFMLRSLVELYSIFCSKITVFDRKTSLSIYGGISKLDLSDLLIPTEHYISLKSAFDKLCMIFDRLFEPKYKNLHRSLSKSSSFVVVVAVEKVSRKILIEGIKIRASAETSWDNSSHELEDSIAETLRMMSDEFWNSYNNEPLNFLDTGAESLFPNAEEFDQQQR